MGICKSCGRGTLEPRLNSSPFLIVKESTTANEREAETIFLQTGKNKWGYDEHTSSYYLNKEMGKVGLQLNAMSYTALYLHEPSTSKKTKEAKELAQGCKDYSVQQVIEVAKGKKLILLMGAEAIRTFTGYPATDVYGLLCKSELLPDVPVIVPAPNPDKLMLSPIGELRNSLRVFAEQVAIYKQFSTILGG